MALQIEGTASTKQFKVSAQTSGANPNLGITIIGYGSTSEDNIVRMDIRIPIIIL